MALTAHFPVHAVLCGKKKRVPGQLKLDLCCGAELMAVAFMESDRSVLKAQTRDFALAGIRVSAAFKSTLVAT